MDEMLKELAANDGACLYWQMSNPKQVLAAVERGELRMEGDLVIHPDAIEIERGMAYTMQRERYDEVRAEDHAIEARAEARAICAKWIAKCGMGFHPDTRGADYSPPLSGFDAIRYEHDMARLFALGVDPYAIAIEMMQDMQEKDQ